MLLLPVSTTVDTSYKTTTSISKKNLPEEKERVEKPTATKDDAQLVSSLSPSSGRVSAAASAYIGQGLAAFIKSPGGEKKNKRSRVSEKPLPDLKIKIPNVSKAKKARPDKSLSGLDIRNQILMSYIKGGDEGNTQNMGKIKAFLLDNPKFTPTLDHLQAAWKLKRKFALFPLLHHTDKKTLEVFKKIAVEENAKFATEVFTPWGPRPYDE